MGKDRRRAGLGGLVLATLLAALFAACGATATEAPTLAGAGSPSAVPTASASAGASGSALPVSLAPGSSASGVPATPGGSAAAPPSAASTPAATGYPLPPVGTIRTFSCSTLLPTKTLTSITKWPSNPIAIPTGSGGPKLAKGQTDCSYSSAKFTTTKSGFSMTDYIITITLLTGGARSQFDQTWEAYQSSPLVATVTGVGDAARWQAATLTLAGLRGRTAFTIQLTPYPLDAFSATTVEKVAVAIGRAIAPHL